MEKLDMKNMYYVCYNPYGIQCVNNWVIYAFETKKEAQGMIDRIGGVYDGTGTNVVAQLADFRSAAAICEGDYEEENPRNGFAQYVTVELDYCTDVYLMKAYNKNLYDMPPEAVAIEVVPDYVYGINQLIVKQVSELMIEDHEVAESIMNGSRSCTDYYDLPLAYLYKKPDIAKCDAELIGIAKQILDEDEDE